MKSGLRKAFLIISAISIILGIINAIVTMIEDGVGFQINVLDVLPFIGMILVFIIVLASGKKKDDK